MKLSIILWDNSIKLHHAYLIFQVFNITQPPCSEKYLQMCYGPRVKAILTISSEDLKSAETNQTTRQLLFLALNLSYVLGVLTFLGWLAMTRFIFDGYYDIFTYLKNKGCPYVNYKIVSMLYFVLFYLILY